MNPADAPEPAGETLVFDYVVVGSGAAGAIVASRLAESTGASVCVLEAGPSDWHPYLRIPAGFIKVLFNPRYTWPFSSEPTEQTGGRRIPVPQGRVLGGSTSINGLIYNRGQAQDYDDWAALGNPGWGWLDVLPYFQKTENYLQAGADPALRGQSGPLRVTPLPQADPLCEAFMQGAQALGLPRNPDYNGATQAGVGYFQRTIAHGLRVSTARAFLHPAQRRTGLTVLTHAHATQVLLHQRRAVGVRFMHGGAHGQLKTAMARKEVVLCAGAINTPRLLQLSGIGPPALLQSLGMTVHHDLPGVGEHLQDHFSVRLVARARNARTINQRARAPRLWGEVARWMLGRPSVLSMSPSLVHFFWQTQAGLQRPDVQGVFTPASYREGYVGMLDNFPGMTCGVWQHRPQSQGHVRLQSAQPFVAPLVQPHYLAHEQDRQVLLAGVRLARRLLHSEALAPYRAHETLPGADVQSDAELLDYIRHYGVSSYHLNGSCKMGPAQDRLAVVNASLQVHGLQGLRVIDASVMPQIPSANTCAATMMIGEKGAQLLRSDC